MARLKVEIVTPARRVLSQEADDVYLPGAAGEIGILPGHAALVSELSTGVVRVRAGGRETKLAVCKGFLRVQDDEVTLLADQAALPEEIDAAALGRELEALQAKLTAEGVSLAEREAAHEPIAWAKARLKVAA